jgi:hypothetical protein
MQHGTGSGREQRQDRVVDYQPRWWSFLFNKIVF